MKKKLLAIVMVLVLMFSVSVTAHAILGDDPLAKGISLPIEEPIEP